MSNAKHETIAEIIASKRSEAQYIRENNDTLIGRKDALKLEEEAGRIETAWKREREAGAEAAQICGEIGEMIGREAACKLCNRLGNAAKMREACEALMSDIGGYLTDGLEVIWCGISGETIKKARSALSAPPRNCDRFANANEALKAFEKEKGETLIEFIRWLFAETKGDAK